MCDGLGGIKGKRSFVSVFRFFSFLQVLKKNAQIHKIEGLIRLDSNGSLQVFHGTWKVTGLMFEESKKMVRGGVGGIVG